MIVKFPSGDLVNLELVQKIAPPDAANTDLVFTFGAADSFTYTCDSAVERLLFLAELSRAMRVRQEYLELPSFHNNSTVTQVTPDNANKNVPIIINGTNFSPTFTLKIGGVEVIAPTYINETTILAYVPTLDIATIGFPQDVRYEDQYGYYVLEDYFDYLG